MDLTRREIISGSAAILMSSSRPSAAAGPDETQRKLKVVVAGAQPDDPESACGGTITLYTDAGHEVVCVYLTRGEAGVPNKSHEEASRIRTAEAEAACKILGSRPVFAGQIDGATELNAARYDELHGVLMQEKPDIVITHWPVDTHRDHRIISMLVYDAWLREKRGFDLYYFEVESGEQTQLFAPTHYVDITSTEPRKREACYAHKSQGARIGFYRLHEQMNKFRGREAGVEQAEAFVRHNGKLSAIL
jgi:LmbE family N-acetylglucosaminyl deacetylase